MIRLCTSILVILGLWSAVPAAPAAAAPEIDLTEIAATLPYEAQPILGLNHLANRSPYMGTTIVLFDIDGDGFEEMITSQPGYVSAKSFRADASVTYWQVNLDPEYVDTTDGAAPCALAICEGPTPGSQPELVAWSTLPDGSRWRFWVIDPVAATVRATFELPGGQDIRPDGEWDGNYFVVGAGEVAHGDSTVRALILGCNVGYDKFGRALLAVDPSDGTILWRFDMGPNPFPRNAHLADLNADGRPEIVVAARAPHNLAGELINGTSDDFSRLFVLDTDGHLLWERVLGPYHGTTECVVADMAGDGRLEVITSTRADPSQESALVVWSARGDTIAAVTDRGPYAFVHVIRRDDRPHPSLLVSAGPRLHEYDFAPDALELRHSALFPADVVVNAVADILPGEGTEAVVSVHQTARYVLDENFKPQTTIPVNGLWVADAIFWRPTEQTRLLLWPKSGQAPSLLTASPAFARDRSLPWLLGGGLLLAGGATVLIWRRRRRSQQRISPLLRHETRLRLLEMLELSSHGAVAPLKAVRRLLWHLKALESTEGDNSRLEYRMRETWTECHESALPLLGGIAARVAAADVPADLAAEVDASLTDLEYEIDRLPSDDFTRIRENGSMSTLDAAQERAGRALMRLRQEITADFRCDIAAAAARVLQANGQLIGEVGARASAGLAAAAAGGAADDAVADAPLHALCDTREFEYVLDNLVGNAVAAMRDSERRHLTVAWHATDGMVAVDVTDTGCGLAEETWERALGTRYSTKPGGGAGLPTSRRYLRKYGGSLAITSSRPGHGTTVRILLPRL